MVIDEAKRGSAEQFVQLDSNEWKLSNLSSARARFGIVDRPSPNEWANTICRIGGSIGHLQNEPTTAIVLRASLPVARCPLPVARCPLPVARCPLPVGVVLRDFVVSLTGDTSAF
ncbi:MAG: hypothetical protein ACI91Q_000339 [Gammaproteobacteria bacterium]|jgi:hypothetical protein